MTDNVSQHQNLEPKLAIYAGIASMVMAISLVIMKIYVVYETDSMSILAGLTDSALDVLASLMNFMAIRWSIIPADEDHRFGHGKAEALAGLGQSTLIATSSLLLIWENIHRFINPSPLNNIDLGIMVTIISLIFTMLLISFQSYVIRKTNSLAIKADRMHYQSDIFLNLGILASLGLSYFYQSPLWDAFVSTLIAFYILWSIREIMAQSFDQIMDKEFPEDIREKIFHLVMSNKNVKDMHDLRTRMSGAWCFIQFHLALPRRMPLEEAHKIAETVENSLQEHFPQAEIFIHLDPEGDEPENPLPYTVH